MAPMSTPVTSPFHPPIKDTPVFPDTVAYPLPVHHPQYVAPTSRPIKRFEGNGPIPDWDTIFSRMVPTSKPKKPDPDAELSARMVPTFNPKSPDMDVKRAVSEPDILHELGERASKKRDGPFTLQDLEGTVREKRRIVTYTREEVDLEDLLDVEGEDDWSFRDIVGPGKHAEEGSKVARKEEEVDPMDTDHWVVNDMVARQHNAAFERPTTRFAVQDGGLQGLTRPWQVAVYSSIVGGALLVVAGITMLIWHFRRRREDKRSAASQHGFTGNLPEARQAFPIYGLRRDIETGGTGLVGPSITSNLPLDNGVDAATGKRVSFNVPGEEATQREPTIVKDFEEEAFSPRR